MTISRGPARLTAIVGRLLIGLLWLVTAGVAGAIGLEWLWERQQRAEISEAEARARPRFVRLDSAYRGFHVHHLHPQYLFFFPLEPAERIAISNDVGSLDSAGFRGQGPARAGGRRLAFLLGGSAAFGTYASSDSTTITGYLNRLQDQYFFVNAGVPGWNSTQELFRVAFEILDYRPALVMTYDGANDTELLRLAYAAGSRYPVGTPENFDQLLARVEEPQAHGERVGRAALQFFFPELTRRLGAARRPATRDSPESSLLPENLLQQGVARYLANLSRARDLTTAAGARFVAVFQPTARLHGRVPPEFELDPGERDAAVRFHEGVVRQRPRELEFHDLARVFDQYFPSVPVMGKGVDLTDETVFVHDAHLNDPGNRIVAEHLIDLLRLSRSGERRR